VVGKRKGCRIGHVDMGRAELMSECVQLKAGRAWQQVGMAAVPRFAPYLAQFDVDLSFWLSSEERRWFSEHRNKVPIQQSVFLSGFAREIPISEDLRGPGGGSLSQRVTLQRALSKFADSKYVVCLREEPRTGLLITRTANGPLYSCYGSEVPRSRSLFFWDAGTRATSG
jgi:hypothetical protein